MISGLVEFKSIWKWRGKNSCFCRKKQCCFFFADTFNDSYELWSQEKSQLKILLLYPRKVFLGRKIFLSPCLSTSINDASLFSSDLVHLSRVVEHSNVSVAAKTFYGEHWIKLLNVNLIHWIKRATTRRDNSSSQFHFIYGSTIPLSLSNPYKTVSECFGTSLSNPQLIS